MVELAKRGQCAFDDAALIHGLAATPVDEGSWCEIDPGLFEQYNQYYSLGFEKIGAMRSYGVVAVGQERIFVQTFRPTGDTPVAWALVCHGYYDHMGLYGHLVAELLQRNIAVMGLIRLATACLPDPKH